MMKFRSILTFAAAGLSMLLGTIEAQTVEYAHFTHYTTKEGLVANRVLSLCQDPYGFIWAATDYGLERFDGSHFRHFRQKDYPILPREDLLMANYMPDGKVMIGSFNGLLMEYNPLTDRFENVMPDEFNKSYYRHISGIYIAPKGDRYVYTTGSIFRYNPRTHKYDTSTPLFHTFQYQFIRSMLIDRYGQTWVGTSDKLSVCDARGKEMLTFGTNPCLGKSINTLLSLGDDRIAVVAPYVGELWVFETGRGHGRVVTHINLPFSNVNGVIKDHRGRMWFATDGDGLWYTDNLMAGQSAVFHTLYPFNIVPDDVKKLYAIIEDKQGNIWIGTQNSGLWKYEYQKQSGVSFSSDFGFPVAACAAFQEDGRGNLIVGVDGRGLYGVSLKTLHLRNYPLRNDNVTSIGKMSDGRLQISTWGKGILTFNPATCQSSPLSFAGVERPTNNFFSVGCLPNGEIYACSAGDGMYMRTAQGQWQRQPLKDSTRNIGLNYWIYKVVNGRNGDMWVLTSNTLWLKHNGKYKAVMRDLSTIKSYNPMELHDAICDADGSLYVATNLGVVHFGPDGRQLPQLSFLPMANYRIILKDAHGQLWLAGSKGILSFSPARKAFFYLPGDYTDVSKCYFYNRAGYCDSRGTLYFGTNGGFFFFNPDQIRRVPPKIGRFAFSELYEARQKVSPYSGVLADGNLAQLKELSLKYNQTDFSIRFDVVDYYTFDQVQCRYRLKGFNNEWIELGQEREINFTHLPVGSYQLQVEAYRPNMAGSEKTIELNINILPPWWQTWWFRLALALLLIGGAVFVVWRRLQNLVSMRNELKMKVDERTQELRVALSDKDRLISVIAHDLKNPMFAIVGALENLMKHKSEMPEEEKTQVIGEVYSSASSLQNEMQNLLDWTRSGREGVDWHVTDVNLEALTDEVLLLLRDMLRNKHLVVTKDFHIDHLAQADSCSLKIVIQNLLTNSIKFTPAGGRLTIKAWQEDDTLNVQFADTGVGMDEAHLFNLRTQGYHTSTAGTNNEAGTGLGFSLCQNYVERNGGHLSVESQVGQGTQVLVQLPASDKALTALPSPVTAAVSDVTADEVDHDLLAGNTILVVDDDPLIRHNLSDMLCDYVSVLTADNGQTAMAVAQSIVPDLILSDVEMPVMNGIELGKVLSQSPDTRHIPILFVSARNADSDRLVGLLTGAIDYIAKPFSQTELLIKITNILRVRQNQQKKILSDLLAGKKEVTAQPQPVKKKEETINPFLASFIKELDQHYADNQLSVEVLAQNLCVSQSTLSRKLKTLTGKTPIDLLIEYRLNAALRLLKDKDSGTSVTDIAFKVGFNDPSYFSRKFKDVFGYPPSQVKP